MARRALIVGLAAVLAAAVSVRGARASPEKRAIILVRTLTYDDNLKKRMGRELVIAVVGRRESPASEACSASMSQAFGALSHLKVLGAPLRVMQLWYAGGDALGSAIVPQGIDVLYLCEGLDGDLPVIVDVARKQQVLTMGATEGQVTRGVAVGVVVVESKPTLFVNLTAAKSSGAALSTDLLRVAKVIR